MDRWPAFSINSQGVGNAAKGKNIGKGLRRHLLLSQDRENKAKKRIKSANISKTLKRCLKIVPKNFPWLHDKKQCVCVLGLQPPDGSSGAYAACARSRVLFDARPTTLKKVFHLIWFPRPPGSWLFRRLFVLFHTLSSGQSYFLSFHWRAYIRSRFTHKTHKIPWNYKWYRRSNR